MFDIKKQIYKRIKPAFKDSPDEPTDEWINQMLLLQIKDNTPIA